MREVMRALPRRDFLPPGFVPPANDSSFDASHPVPLGNGRTLPTTNDVAIMIGGLGLVGAERVLEIGTGSGYQAAVLGRLAKEVYSVEPDRELAERAATLLKARGCTNTHVIHAEGDRGWPEAAPYDAILISGGIADIPLCLVDQLTGGGRLVVALGEATAQLVVRLMKGVDTLVSETLGASSLAMLPRPGAEQPHFPWS